MADNISTERASPMNLQLPFRNSLMMPALAASLVFAFPASSQNADDVAKIQTGSCGSQSDGSDKCDVTGADLRDILLNGQYHHLTAIGTDFSGSKLRNAFFSKADLTDTDFSEINSMGGAFNGNNLTGASFYRASLRHMNFDYNNLTNANLTDARIDNLEAFTKNIYCNTTMPDGSINNRDC